SQLWIFGVYELLRTWRQRAREVLTFGEEVQKLSEQERKERISEKRRKFQVAAKFAYGSETHHVKSFERAANDQEFLSSVEMALYRVERLFRRIEALRMSLAKHELPKAKGSLAMAPGYGRIDMENGSICWQVLLRNNEVDTLSGRTIADQCRKVIDADPIAAL